MTFEKAIKHVLSSEGGFTLDPDDTGNWTGRARGKGLLKGTKYGISAASYPALDIKNLTLEEAEAIYKRDYWQKYKIDYLPEHVRLHFFDVCVNSGYSRAVKILQRAAGIAADGVFGADTKANLPRVTVWGYAQERVAFYVNHAQLNPGKIKFLKGWIIRVLEVTKNSL